MISSEQLTTLPIAWDTLNNGLYKQNFSGLALVLFSGDCHYVGNVLFHFILAVVGFELVTLRIPASKINH